MDIESVRFERSAGNRTGECHDRTLDTSDRSADSDAGTDDDAASVRMDTDTVAIRHDADTTSVGMDTGTIDFADTITIRRNSRSNGKCFGKAVNLADANSGSGLFGPANQDCSQWL